MVINHELLFIHIPKTGGTSCTDYLCQTLRRPVFCSSIKFQHAEKHFNATLFEGYSHETLDEIYSNRSRIMTATGIDPTVLRNVFAVIRNPYSLELSNYLFFRNGRQNLLKGPAFQVPHVQEKVELAQGSFENFVRNCGYFRDDLAGQQFRTEDYLTLNGEIPDFLTILKAEELDDVFPQLTRPFRERDDIAFPHSNQSARPGDMTFEDIDAATRAAIREKHRWLFEEGYYSDHAN